MKCGDIVLVDFPFTDDTGSKLRPVLLVSADEYNRGEDRICIPISSVLLADDPFGFPLGSSQPWFKRTGLRRDSSVKWTKPFTISRHIIRRRLGVLGQRPLAEVSAKIQSLFE